MNPLTALCEPTASLSLASIAPMDTKECPASGHPFVTGIDWNAVEAHVARLQRQLARAVEQHNRPAIRHYKPPFRTLSNVCFGGNLWVRLPSEGSADS